MATRKTDAADVFAFSAFDPARMTENYREFAEKSMAQSKDTYARLYAAAEGTTRTIEASLENAQAGSVELGQKAIDFMRVNTGNSLAHLEALLGVRSVAEVMELQTAFFRKQVELSVVQAKALQEISRKVAEDMARPAKTAGGKAAPESKAA